MNYISGFLKANGNVGANKGIKATALLLALGRSTDKDSIRRLQQEIRQERLEWTEQDGEFSYIVSDTEHGYYLPKNLAEIERFIKTQDSRAKKCFLLTSKLKKRYREAV